MIAAKNIRTVPLRFAAGKISLPRAVSQKYACGQAGAPGAVMTDGRLVKCSAPFSRQDIGECFLELCGNSVHSFAREISEGYITLPEATGLDSAEPPSNRAAGSPRSRTSRR